MYHDRSIFTIAVFGLVLAVALILVSTRANSAPGSWHVWPPPASYNSAEKYGWSDAKWTDDNAPYAAVRKADDSKAASDSGYSAPWQSYRAAAFAHPDDRVAMFAWAYCSWKALPSLPAGEQAAVRMEVKPPLEYTSLPSTYDWARMRFLFASDRCDPRLIPVGRRLIAEDPTDTDVLATEARLVFVHSQISHSAALLAEAKGDIDSCIRAAPSSPLAYGMLYDYYFYQWTAAKTRDDLGRSALEASKEYLKRLGPADPRALVVAKGNREIEERLGHGK